MRGFRVGLALLSLALPLCSAAGEEAPYADRARATILHLLAERVFTAEAGCDRGEPCAQLLARLREGAFEVLAPAERSDEPDLPSYRQLRRKCPGLDPARIVVGHRSFAATRGFAIYRLDGVEPRRKHEEVIVFLAHHYVASGAQARGTEGEADTLLPGTFTVIGLPSCRFLATAPAEESDSFAKHNPVADGDFASELLRVDEHLVVLNLTPIAGPDQPKASWWYRLELRDLGPGVDAARQRQKRAYSFGYKPAGEPAGSSRAAASPFSPG